MEVKTVMILILIILFLAIIVFLGAQYASQAREQGGFMNELAFGLFEDGG